MSRRRAGAPLLSLGAARPLVTPLAGTRTIRAMASTGVKTLLKSKEIRDAVDPALGTHAQPPAPRCQLGPGAPQPLTKSASVSFLCPFSAELPRSAPPPHCGTLKRTFACTNLLLLGLADAEAPADREAAPGPRFHTPQPRGNDQPSASPLRQERSSPRLACPAEDDGLWHATSRRSTQPL